MKYYIGIDGGGTGSRLVAADEEQRVLYRCVGRSTNLASNSSKTVFYNIQELFVDLYKNSNLKQEDCYGLCIGSAGLDYEANFQKMGKIFNDLGFTKNVVIVNDSMLPLAASTEGVGVILISGTGSISYGVNSKGEVARCGGWGHVIDDCGSGYWMGKEALSRAFFAFDGRGEKTVLVDKFKEFFGLEILSESLANIYGEKALNKSEIAAFSAFVEEGARAGDVVCWKIIEQAVEDLYKLISGVISRLGEDDLTIVLSGGILTNDNIVAKHLNEILRDKYPKSKIMNIDKEPVLGAVNLAIKAAKGEA